MRISLRQIKFLRKYPKISTIDAQLGDKIRSAIKIIKAHLPIGLSGK
jgi:hypothetical protein